MIESWSISNFKAVRHPANLLFRPLTILAGPNSTGKSTVLQSILMVSQTLASKLQRRTVLLNGPMTRLGQFEDLLSHPVDSGRIQLAWHCSSRKPDSGIEWNRDAPEVPFEATPLSIKCELVIESPMSGTTQYDQPRLASFSLAATETDLEDQEPIYVFVEREPVAPGDLKARLDNISMDQLEQEYPAVKVTGCRMRHFLPVKLAVEFDRGKRESHLVAFLFLEEALPFTLSGRLPTSLMRKEIPPAVIRLLQRRAAQTQWGTIVEELIRVDTTPLTLLEWRNRLEGLSQSRKKAIRSFLRESESHILAEMRKAFRSEISAHEIELPLALSGAVEYVDNYFTRCVRYLGPLRDEPKALYPVSGSPDPGDVGLKGEYTASVLNTFRDEEIIYISPAAFSGEAVVPTLRKGPLEVAVVEWLRYLGVSQDLVTSDRGKLGHELRVSTTVQGKSSDLMHVGVGVSQVLPILVICLLAHPDSTLILEQPELHLHPKVQTLLGDFFLAVSLSGRQCILETHSEYLINRLRWRTAADPGTVVARNLQIYFTESKHDGVRFQEVHLNAYGAIQDWPEGFFDQTQNDLERIVQAAALKRRKTRPEVT